MEKWPIKGGRSINGTTVLLEDLKMKLLPAIIILAATISLSMGDEATNRSAPKGRYQLLTFRFFQALFWTLCPVTVPFTQTHHYVLLTTSLPPLQRFRVKCGLLGS